MQADVDLLRATSDGDVGAFETLITRYQSLVLAISYSRTGSHPLSEEITQDVFVAVWRHRRKLGDVANFRAWLLGTARNLSAKALRSAKRRQQRETTSCAPKPSPDALETLLNDEASESLWLSLGKLPETFRETLVLYYREDRSARDVADLLGVSENTVHQRLYQGRQQLKQRLAAVVNDIESTRPSKRIVAGVLAVVALGHSGSALARRSVQPRAGNSLWAGAALVAGIAATIGYFASNTASSASARAQSQVQEHRPSRAHARLGKLIEVLSQIPLKPREEQPQQSSDACSPEFANASWALPFRSLKAQVDSELAAIEPQWQQCLDAAGPQPAGSVAIHFSVAQLDGATAVDILPGEGRANGYSPSFVDCLRDSPTMTAFNLSQGVELEVFASVELEDVIIGSSLTNLLYSTDEAHSGHQAQVVDRIEALAVRCGAELGKGIAEVAQQWHNAAISDELNLTPLRRLEYLFQIDRLYLLAVEHTPATAPALRYFHAELLWSQAALLLKTDPSATLALQDQWHDVVDAFDIAKRESASEKIQSESTFAAQVARAKLARLGKDLEPAELQVPDPLK